MQGCSMFRWFYLFILLSTFHVNAFDPENEAYLHQQKFLKVNYDEIPELRAVLKVGQEYLDHLIQKSGLKNSIKLVFIDHEVLMAFGYKHSKSNEILVGVSLGFMRFLQNEDELLAILGHEFRHFTSKIQSHIDQTYNETSLTRSGMKRAIENEVDLASMNDLIDKDRNPHAMLRVLKLIQKLNGDGGAQTHTTTLSRIDSLNSALTYLARQEGRAFKQDVPDQFIPGSIGQFQQSYVLTQKFKTRQLQRFNQFLDELGDKPWFKQMIGQNTYPYEALVHVWPHAEQIITNLLTPDELKEAKIQFFVKVHEAFYHSAEMFNPRMSQTILARNFRESSRTISPFEKFSERVKVGPFPPNGTGAGWLSQFFNVSSWEELPIEVHKVLELNRKRFENSQSTFMNRFSELDPLRSLDDFKELEQYYKHITNSWKVVSPILRDLNSFIEKDLLINALTDYYKAFDKWDNELKETAFDKIFSRIQGLDYFYQIAPNRAINFLQKSYKDYFAQIPLGTVLAPNQYEELLKVLQRGSEISKLRQEGLPLEIKQRAKDLILDYLYAQGPKNYVVSEIVETYYLMARLNLVPELSADDVQKFLRSSIQYRVEELRMTQEQALSHTLYSHPKMLKLARKYQLTLPDDQKLSDDLLSLGQDFFQNENRLSIWGYLQLVDYESNLDSTFEKFYQASQALKFGQINIYDPTKGYSSGAYYVWSQINGLRDRLDPSVLVNKWVTQYRQYLKMNHPTDYTQRLIAGEIRIKDSGLDTKNVLHEILEREERKVKDLSEGKRAAAIYDQLIKNHPSLLDSIINTIPHYLKKIGTDSGPEIQGILDLKFPYLNHRSYVYMQIDEHLSKQDLKKYKLDFLIDYLHRSIKINERPNKDRDIIFDYVWRNLKGHYSSGRLAFLQPRYIRALHYDDVRIKLVTATMDHVFDLPRIKRMQRANSSLVPLHHVIRPTVESIEKWIKEIMTEPSNLRDRAIDYVMNMLWTTPAETKRLASLKQGMSNWFESTKLSLLDTPSIISMSLKTNKDRLEFIDYIIGYSDDFEKKLLNKMNKGKLGHENNNDYFLRLAKGQRRDFVEAPEALRGFAIQQLLGNEIEGIISDPEIFELVMHRILGQWADHKEVRSLFDSYFWFGIPGAQRKVVLSHMLQKIADRPAGQGSISISDIFNSMPGLGPKAAQAFRTTGLGSMELQKELDTFFDQSLPPSRDEIVDYIEEVFGKEYLHLVRLRDLRGSGSLNFVVIADIELDGKIYTVAIRMQRKNIKGQVIIEDQNWERAISKMAQDPDPVIVSNANVLNEIRQSIMFTLSDNGTEFDLSKERSLYNEAASTYLREIPGLDGWTSSPVKPLDKADLNIQQLVPHNLSKMVSIYEFVDGVPIDQVEDKHVRQQLAAHVISLELNAFLNLGYYDKDSHPGNWLVVQGKNQVLKRLDYAQLKKNTNQEDVKAFQVAFGTLLRAKVETEELKALEPHFKRIFKTSLSQRDILRHFQVAVNNKDFPEYTTPHLRFFYLRKYLEQASGELVRLQETTTEGLALIARLSLFKDHVGRYKFFTLLTEQLSIGKKFEMIQGYLIDDLNNKINSCRQKIKNVF